MGTKDGTLKEINICNECGKEAVYYIDELKIWLCEECFKKEEEINKQNEKLEKKISKRAYSFNIKKLLESLSRDEIYNIARNLGMAKISGLKKDELLGKLINEYEELIKLRLNLFDEERYHLLRNYLKCDGIKKFDDISEEEAEKSTYFIQQGFLFPTVNKKEEGVFLMPDIVKKALQSCDDLNYRRILKQNTEIINVFRGMNKAYGILSIDTVESMFNKFKVLTNSNLYELLKEAGFYYVEYREESKTFINNYIQDVEKLKNEIEQNKEQSYAVIPKNELLLMSKDEYNLELKAGKEFYNEFTDIFEVNKEIIQNIMDELSIEIQENTAKESIDFIIEEMNIEDDKIKSIVTSMMMKFSNKIRMWKYKGYTNNDMKALSMNSNKAANIGRNDLCICGSGKKYKKCCGKNK